MQVQFPLKLSENLVGTLIIKVRVQRETAALAQQLGIDAEELQNLVMQKLAEVSDVLGDQFGLSAE